MRPSLPTIVHCFGSLGSGSCVTNEQKHSDTGLFTGIDLRAFWETVRLRWWIIPAVIVVSVGFLWAQESDLQTEPATYLVRETYEARDPTGVLASVGIDPAAIRPFPDAASLLSILQSQAVRKEIVAEAGVDIPVTVSRTAPTFTLVDTLETDGKSSFVFQSMGTPTYIYACSEPAKSECADAIAAYVEKTIELRRDAFTAGLSDLKSVLVAARDASGDQSLDAKIAAVDIMQSRLDVPMVRIGVYEQNEGPTVSTVRRPTYLFGAAAGLIIALLILLQLTYSDRRIRSVRHVTRLVGDGAFLGEVASATSKSNPVTDRRTAISLHNAQTSTAAGGIRFIPLSQELTDTVVVERLRSMCGTPVSFAEPFTTLGIAELTADTDDVDVLVIQRHIDLRQALGEAVEALRRGGRRFGGVLLLD